MGKRKSFESGFKLKVMSYAEKFGNRAVERKFQLSEKVTRRWKKQKDISQDTKYSRAIYMRVILKIPIFEPYIGSATYPVGQPMCGCTRDTHF